MKNPTPRTQIGVFALVLALIKGALEHGITIGLTHITAAVLLALRVAAITARDAYEAGKLVLSDRRIAFNEAFEVARDFASVARDILKPHFGKQYNQRWDVTGFVNGLALPDTLDEMLILLEALKNFFTANPTLEVGTITAAQAGLVFEALSNARSAVDSQSATLNALMTDRDAKVDALRKGIRDLINELDTLIDPMDARWLAFGLNRPGADETPDVPTGLTAILIGPNAAATKWEAPARAVYYRVWMKIHGSTADYAAMGAPADLDFTLENLPANSTLDVAVSALNNGGESALSEPITITTH